MAHRFRFLATKKTDQQWLLLDDELRHATKVLRLKDGDPIEVCDGRGSWAEGAWQSGLEKSGLLSVATTYFTERPKQTVTLCLGALKHQELDDLIPQLSEVGVDRLLVFLHGQLEKSRIHERAVDRWEKIAWRSAKQCKRAWVMGVEVFPSLEAMCKALPDGGVRLLASGSGEMALMDFGSFGDSATLVVGSEAGLSVDEESYLVSQHGFRTAQMGPFVLRAVTCALVGAAVLAMRLEKS